MISQKTVGILVFPDVEVLDFCGPFEVFSVTRLDEERRRETLSPFRVLLIGHGRDAAGAIRTTGGMRVVPDVGLDDCPALDFLLVPGGWGTRALMHEPALLQWIAARALEVEMLLSVCTGSLLLGKAGLLPEGTRVTTHWRSLDLLGETAPGAEVVRDEHVVEHGTRLLTSAGISAGIELALRVVARMHGETVARNTARYMEYRFPEDNRRHI
jgi:transcriptional regulator GlxA family with amidase domain